MVLSSQLDFIKQLHGDSPVPYAVISRDFLVLWANDCALHLYPQLGTPGGLAMLLGSEQLEQAKNQSGAFSVTLGGLQHFSASFTPVEDGFLMSVGFTDAESVPSMLPQSIDYIISSLSSRIRHPLSNIFAGASALYQREEIQNDEKLLQLVESINSDSYSMLRFSVDFTAYLRYILGNENFYPEHIDLSDFLTRFVSAAGIITGSVDINIKADIPDSKVIVFADQNAINYALLHVISNCCRFAPDDASIKIKLEADESTAKITVSDNGPGIPADILSKVCEPFFSYDPLGEPLAGCGLGLAIARQAIIRNNGSFVITSAPGKGTTVAISLPIAGENEVTSLKSPAPVADVLRDRFSLMHIILSDSCGNPKP